MQADKNNVKALARQNQEETTTFFNQLKRKKPKRLDDVIHLIHAKVSEKFDCLTCGNCCKSISPRITDKDIERIAHKQKMKEVDFIARYLHVDDDQWFVFNQTPCPFLMSDNFCMIYDYRPKACSEYPHTDRRRFYQLLDLTMQNRELCPIVYEVIERLKKEDFGTKDEADSKVLFNGKEQKSGAKRSRPRRS
jgi:Fe-S-cluster containining protein